MKISYVNFDYFNHNTKLLLLWLVLWEGFLRKIWLNYTKGTHQSSVSRIIKKYLAHPQQVLQTKPHLGASKRVSDEQLEQVKSWASHNPVDFEGQYWTRARFQVLIRDKFGVNYQLKQVGNILKQLNITWQKARLKDYRQKPEQVEEWRQERLPTIKKKLSSRKA